jgi:hypothetical protein
MAKGQMTEKVSFDSPPSLDELIDALDALREKAGGDAVPRVRVTAEFNANGGRVKSVSADREV